MNYTKDQVAQAIIAEGQTARTSGTAETLHPVMTPLQIQIALATALVESNDTVYANSNVPESFNYPHDAVGSDHMSTGDLQQQPQWWGTVAEEMDPRLSAAMFYQHLAKDMAAHPGRTPGQYAQDVQGSAYPDRYAARMNDAVLQYNRLVGVGPVADPRIAALLAVRPDFNEFPNWCQNANGHNWQSRNGTRIDCLTVHTQEGAENDDNAALDLSNFEISSIGGGNPVSYHDAVRQASDGGVTVVNSVDTDYACWAVGNSNNRSINRCFAGSDASWTRAQWMTQRNAIRVMAYLMVMDALKYNIDISDPASITFGPNYSGRKPPVVSDHRYFTEVLRDGNTHTDVGDGFPVDIYAGDITYFWQAANGTVPTAPADPPHPVIPPAPTFEQWLNGASEIDLLRYIAAQLGPGDPSWASKGKTLRDEVFGV